MKKIKTNRVANDKISRCKETHDSTDINDASLMDPVDKAIKKAIAAIKTGKGVDEKALKEVGVGGVLAMFLKLVIQGAAVESGDVKNFWKTFKGGLG